MYDLRIGCTIIVETAHWGWRGRSHSSWQPTASGWNASSKSNVDSNEKYGKPLEKKHKGEFIAISLEGEIILDKRLGELLKQATDTFGHDNFAMARVGHDAMAEWLHVG